jgi:hypothetical protein
MFRHLTRLIAVFSAVAFAACANQSPTRPDGMSDTGGPDRAAAAEAGESSPLSQAVLGTYELSFVDSSLQTITQLPVCDGELVLKAHVEDSAGAPVQSGTVVFEYCSYKGLPPGDITRADEAPLEACASGEATWRRLRAHIELNASGDAYLTFGVVRIPRTVGFRFRYIGQGSGIANSVSEPENFTWVAGTCPS